MKILSNIFFQIYHNHLDEITKAQWLGISWIIITAWHNQKTIFLAIQQNRNLRYLLHWKLLKHINIQIVPIDIYFHSDLHTLRSNKIMTSQGHCFSNGVVIYINYGGQYCARRRLQPPSTELYIYIYIYPQSHTKHVRRGYRCVGSIHLSPRPLLTETLHGPHMDSSLPGGAYMYTRR